jgi:hypothetical protein
MYEHCLLILWWLFRKSSLCNLVDNTPQTLKLIGYIKHRKVIIMIDSGSTHNFIHHRIAQETHCYIHVVNNFQIMIANDGFMKCGGHYENVHLQMEDWLRTLGPMIMDFKALTMQFDQEGHQYKFQGIIVASPQFISSHRMEKMLKKGRCGVISQLHAIRATETPPVLHDLQDLLSKHQMAFSTPQGLPPSHSVHDHSIPLLPKSLPPNICP